MSGLRQDLLTQLRRYDDDAWIALANRGLLRRALKDLDSQTVRIVEESDAALVVEIGVHRVGFDARGPAQARCDCPAGGICQHILAAAIGLQRNAAALDTEQACESAAAVSTDAVEPAVAAETDMGDPPPADPNMPVAGDAAPPTDTDALSSLRKTLLETTPDTLNRYAGKAGYRWAWQFVQDLDIERNLHLSGDHYPVIAFASPRITFRYMGGSLDNLVADLSLSSVEKYRVAAVLALQRAHGITIAAPEPARKPKNMALDLGKDHALPDSAGARAQHESRERLRQSTRQLLIESVELGLSHLSDAVQQRYATLAVWAQGAEYPRLALLLRRLSDHVELLLDRAGAADEHLLLDEIALSFALTDALEQAAQQGTQPAHLLGRPRSRYELAGTLDLWGLGANAWRSAAGYAGLTLLFWSPQEQGFVSCADVRPEQQGGFDPVARYRTPGPWAGLNSPKDASGHKLSLTGAQLNAAGRLSMAATVSATVEPTSNEEFLRALPVQTHWKALRQERQRARRSLLAELRPMRDWAVIRPASVAAAQFDGNRQALVWPVYDQDDDALLLELAYGPFTQHAIERIEQLAPVWRDGDLLLVRLRGEADHLRAEPLSRIGDGAGIDGGPVDALHFDPAPKGGFASQWRKLWKRQSPAVEQQDEATVAVIPGPLRELRHWLQQRAERGANRETTRQTRHELEARLDTVRQAGFSAFSAPGDDQSAAAHLIRTHYLCMQYQRLLGADVPSAE